jgi:uncharacterized membrane protein
VTRRAHAAERPRRIGNRLAPARFVAFLVLLPLCFLAYRHLLPGANWKDALTMAFDFAAFCFLASLLPLLRDIAPSEIRRHAQENDANRLLVLVFTSILMLAVMAAIGGELSPAKGGDVHAMAKLICTLVIVWLFANSVYALHYAHEYYAAGADKDVGGIDFPATKTPVYSDFVYFAFTIGMTFQTSDVAITSAPLRRVAVLHSMAAFVFNIGVIAFTINALGGGS